MHLPKLISKKDTPVTPLFFALELQDGLVKSALWKIEAGKASIVSTGVPSPYKEIDGLVAAADSCISSLNPPEDQEPNQVILGLPEHWLSGDKVVPPFNQHLKKLLEELELTAMGFVTTTEAVIQHIQTLEGIPPTAVIIETTIDTASVTLVKLGQIIGRQTVGRSDDLAKDVQEGLARISSDQYPPRFILLSSKSPQEDHQQLTSYAWTDVLPFLHLPKVELPPDTFTITAIALSGGGEAVWSSGIDVDTTPATPPPAIDSSPVDTTPPPGDNFGFVSDLDIRAQTTPTPAPPPEATPDLPPPPPPTHAKRTLPRISLPQFHLHLPQLKRTNLWIILLPLFIIFIAAAGTVFYYLSNAVVNIDLLVTTKPFSKDLVVPLSSTNAPDTVPYTTQTITVTVNDSLAATGEATVGDKANGEVVILNKTDSPKVLKPGSVLTTDNNLSFILNDSVTIASRSAQEVNQAGSLGQLIVYGQEKVKVTAGKIGTQYNLAADTSLSVATFPKSSLEAKVVGSLAGGTSRTVQAVSDKDRQLLLTQLQDKAKQEAQSQVRKSDTEESFLLGDLKIIRQTFSHGVGEEATSFSLELQAEQNIGKVALPELSQFISDKIKSEVYTGFKVSEADSTYQIEISNAEEDKLTAKVHYATKVIPDLDPNAFAPNFVLKSESQVREILRRSEGYEGARFRVSPNIPLLNSFMPLKSDNIHLQVTTTR